MRALRKAGSPVNARVVLAAAEEIVTATDCTLLFENGGHIKLSLDACTHIHTHTRARAHAHYKWIHSLQHERVSQE